MSRSLATLYGLRIFAFSNAVSFRYIHAKYILQTWLILVQPINVSVLNYPLWKDIARQSFSSAFFWHCKIFQGGLLQKTCQTIMLLHCLLTTVCFSHHDVTKLLFGVRPIKTSKRRNSLYQIIYLEEQCNWMHSKGAHFEKFGFGCLIHVSNNF